MPDKPFRGHNLVKKMIAALVSNSAGNFLLVAFIMTAKLVIIFNTTRTTVLGSQSCTKSLSLSLDLGNLLLSLLQSATQ